MCRCRRCCAQKLQISIPIFVLTQRVSKGVLNCKPIPQDPENRSVQRRSPQSSLAKSARPQGNSVDGRRCFPTRACVSGPLPPEVNAVPKPLWRRSQNAHPWHCGAHLQPCFRAQTMREPIANERPLRQRYFRTGNWEGNLHFEAIVRPRHRWVPGKNRAPSAGALLRRDDPEAAASSGFAPGIDARS